SIRGSSKPSKSRIPKRRDSLPRLIFVPCATPSDGNSDRPTEPAPRRHIVAPPATLAPTALTLSTPALPKDHHRDRTAPVPPRRHDQSRHREDRQVPLGGSRSRGGLRTARPGHA